MQKMMLARVGATGLLVGALSLATGCYSSVDLLHRDAGWDAATPRVDAPVGFDAGVGPDAPADAPLAVDVRMPSFDTRRDSPLPDVRLRDAGLPGDRAGDVWDGYIESFHFDSGSDRVRILFDSNLAGEAPTGVVIFGDGDPLVPPTDPNVGYPPGGGRESIAEVFEYPITMATLSSSRVQATIVGGSLWEVWCQLQTSYSVGAESYQCRPNLGGGGSGDGCYLTLPSGEDWVVECGWLDLCDGFTCECSAAGCVAATGQPMSFDFHVTGNAGDGSVRIGGTLYNIHLTR